MTLAPITLSSTFPGHRITRHVVAIAQMLWSALLIHLSGGRIETHFHVFGSLAFLAFYRDWQVLTTAVVIVAADHFLRGVFWPQSVFGIAWVEPWRWLEHSLWVTFEYVLLATLCRSGVRQISEICSQQAELRITNQNIESLVRKRTDELEVLNSNLIHEIQVRREAERKAKELTRELMRTSRQAGMAEVATGVLHNVGNVLNSVSVAISTLQERLRTSRLPGLAKCAELLSGQREEVVQFITSERGLKLPPYLLQLSQQLGDERQAVSDEMRVLRKHVDHITEIVAMQQTYARTGGSIDSIDLRELIDDALKINDAGLLRHGVELRQDIDQLPCIESDKHKLLQILVNLIGNAKHAVSQPQQDVGERIIEITARTSGDAAVVIEVSDNGVGIAEENLDKIFSHGFTTKAEGHGYGLHSSALAARELGGSLSVFSPGEGRGATFCLEIPLAHRARPAAQGAAATPALALQFSQTAPVPSLAPCEE